jgi:hypothetical protein
MGVPPSPTGSAPTCHLCGSPITLELHHTMIHVTCPQHGHFQATRKLWDALRTMTPPEKARCFFQLENKGKRRVLRKAD